MAGVAGAGALPDVNSVKTTRNLDDTDILLSDARHASVRKVPSLLAHHRRRTVRLAWLLLLIAFSIFCTLLASTGYALWDYHTHAMMVRQNTLIARAPLEWISWQREGRTVSERAHHQQELEEGGRLRIAQSAGYGQAATLLLFDNSTLDMWAGADLLLRELQTSRWNNRELVVVLEQYDGYIRYDLRDDQPYQHRTFLVYVDDTRIYLEPGGSYSINIDRPDRRVLLPEATGSPPIEIDIAVRNGAARVESQNRTEHLQAGQRVVVDPAGIPSKPMLAQWELVRDGDFRQHSAEEYNNTTVPRKPTLPRSDTWRVWSKGPSDSQANGFFHVSAGCPPPFTSNLCSDEELTHIAWFRRDGNQTKPFATGVLQMLGNEQTGVDISEYRSLRFSVWVRVLYQSVELTGDEGSECPVMIRFWTKADNSSDADQQRVICLYSSDDPTLEPVKDPAIMYYRIEPYEWYYLEIDLRDEEWLPEARYIRSIEIYANGHDYDARFTDVSLIGSHYGSQPDQAEDVLVR